MASSCKSGSIVRCLPVKGNCDDGQDSVPVECCEPPSEKRRLILSEYNAEHVNRRPISLGETLKWPRNSLKSLIVRFFACAIVVVFVIPQFPSYESFEKILSRLPSCGDNLQAAVTEASTENDPAAVLEVFQVYQPVLTPPGSAGQAIASDGSNTTTLMSMETVSSCTQLLMEHSFWFSYGHPFVGNYTPPPCKFNRVVMNFTVTSSGRQFDRLALMYLGDTEVWRTSTAEPTPNGIRWTYMKDMSEYLYFWNQPQTLIFDLGNLIDSTYTGPFHTTLTATFFASPYTVDPAGLIIPISARKSMSDSASLFILPADTAANTISFPRNANRAVFSVSACGQAHEEFWWSNAFQSNTDTFIPDAGILYGFSPWREVQIYIDGQLAGVQWPFPVVFTGGVAPGLWRPIVGIDAFDLREHEIDITPWLSSLCDGNLHTFEIKVAGIDDNGGTTGTVTEKVGDSWYVTGKIFIWLDDASSITTGSAPTIIRPQPSITLWQSITQNTTGVNQTLAHTTLVTRSLSISSIINSQKGTSNTTWTQLLSYVNDGLFTDQGITQVNAFMTTGLDTSTGAYPYTSSYNYPLNANTTLFVDQSGNFSISATFTHGLDLRVTGNSIYPSGLEPFSRYPNAKGVIPPFSGSLLSTTQNGTAYYFSSPSTKTGISFGSTEQHFSFSGVSAAPSSVEELYSRDVTAVNGTVISDKEWIVGAVVGDYENPNPLNEDIGFQGSIRSPRAAVGRGPGESKPVLAQAG